MNVKSSRLRISALAAAGAMLLCLEGTSRSASVWAATPASQEVREMLDRGRAYLETAPLNTTHATQLGGQSLIGLAAYKYEKRFGRSQGELPTLTQQALARALRDGQNSVSVRAANNYSLGITLVFLTEVLPNEHMAEINVYWNELQDRQKPNGGWGYSGMQTGDTSQLQYAALGAWSAKAVGVDISADIMRNLANYILRVQDPSGAWGYQGNDQGTFSRVIQAPLDKPSLVAAGLGSLYVTADFLGMSAPGTSRQRSNRKLPPALRPVVDDPGSSRYKPAAIGLDTALVRQAMKDGNEWFVRNPSLRTTQWQFYYLYAYERYASFREKVEGTSEEEPVWYNEGVRLLQELQGSNGSWGAGMEAGLSAPVDTDAPVSTAFAMLFLLRSTQETIEKVIERDGILRGGYDLPSDLTEVRLQGNRLVAPAITGEVADLIGMLENDKADTIESLLDHPDLLSLSGLKGEGREYTARLARVVRTGSFQARLVATRALARQGELDNVPILIYALTDPDPRVMREAQAGLRLTSRKLEGFDLSADPQKPEIEALVARWKAWYNSIRPDATFIE